MLGVMLASCVDERPRNSGDRRLLSAALIAPYMKDPAQVS
jgi:hypothetical protein